MTNASVVNEILTVKKLKEFLETLPDDMIVARQEFDYLNGYYTEEAYVSELFFDDKGHLVI